MRNKKITMTSKNRSMKNPQRRNQNLNLHKKNDQSLISIAILEGTMDLLTEACDKIP